MTKATNIAPTSNRAERLWPITDPEFNGEGLALAPWGDYADEDVYEWARLIYSALETWEINSDQIDAHEIVSYPNALYLDIHRDEDGIWTLRVRRFFAYLNAEASARQRWLAPIEIEQLSMSIFGTDSSGHQPARIASTGTTPPPTPTLTCYRQRRGSSDRSSSYTTAHQETSSSAKLRAKERLAEVLLHRVRCSPSS